MCLELLVKSRRVPRAGDVFVMKPKGEDYVFGRVIRSDVGPEAVKMNLLYIYRARSSVSVHVPSLLASDLLMPPVVTNRQGWLQGFFQHVEGRPLDEGDVLPRHWFWDPSFLCFRDEDGVKTRPGEEPPSSYRWSMSGVANYFLVGSEVCDALGLPSAW